MKKKPLKILKYVLLFLSVIALALGSTLIIITKKTPPSRVIDTAYSAEAIFSMGSFLLSEPAFISTQTREKLPGILSITLGHVDDKKAIRIKFNPSMITYKQLLDIFWHNIDPFNAEGQFCSKGSAYTAAIFYSDEKQKTEADRSKKAVEAFLGKKVVTPILKVSDFHPVEEKYQHLFNKNPLRYSYYKWKCKREKTLKVVWGDIGYLYQ